MNVDQAQPQTFANASFAGFSEVQKAQNETMEAIARFLGARPIGNAINIGGGGDLPGFDARIGGDELGELAGIADDLDVRGLSFSDAASILSLARDPAPAANLNQHTAHDAALLGATLAAQHSLAEHAGHDGADHLGVLTDYYAQHVQG
jgi:hypothetical protein